MRGILWGLAGFVAGAGVVWAYYQAKPPEPLVAVYDVVYPDDPLYEPLVQYERCIDGKAYTGIHNDYTLGSDPMPCKWVPVSRARQDTNAKTAR